MRYSIAYVDSKNVCPRDTIRGEVSENISEADFNKHYNKPVRGHVVISNPDTGEIIETPNLVLLSGREFIAQKLANKNSDTSMNSGNVQSSLENFKIRYFGVGSGGASIMDGTNRIGPYDNDLDLQNRRKFNDMSTDAENGIKYIQDGYLKQIESDGGTIELINESHIIDSNSDSNLTVGAITTIKYTMFITSGELFKNTEPFAFNEAALYAVEFDGDIPKENNTDGETNNIWNARYRTFARFTTSTKLLDASDSLKIEWFILC